MTPKSVIATIRGATEDGDPGQVTNGFYVVEDGVLIMTKPDGKPHSGPDGKPIQNKTHRHTLRPGDNPDAIASVLTKKIRRETLGLTEEQESFRGKLKYGPLGIA